MYGFIEPKIFKDMFAMFVKELKLINLSAML